MDLHPQLLTLSQLFSGRLFNIPDYQRAYSWSTRQRQDLFDDLWSVGDDENADHFMATVVCLRGDRISLGIDEYQRLDIVDGQQRITTLVLLLNAVALSLQTSDDPSEKAAATSLRELLVKPGSDKLLLLQTNQGTSRYFADYLYEGIAHDPAGATTLADRQLLLAIQDCREFVALWAEDESVASLARVIQNRLSLILHEIGDEKTVYTVFEVLNSRGMPVSWLDRLKTILMGAAFEIEGDSDELVSYLHEIWRDIYRVMGLRQGLSTESLRFAATLRAQSRPNRPLSEEAAVDELRSKIETPAQIRDVGRWLLRVTQACDKIHKDARRNAVTQIVQARLLAVAIELKGGFRRAVKDELLQTWEKVVFRIYGMMRRDARTSVGDFVRLGWGVLNESLSYQDIAARIDEIGKQYPMSAATQAMRGSNCYEGWEDHLRYFMARYEEHLAQAGGVGLADEVWEQIWSQNASRSIEHVWPQSTAPEDVVHNLGNLVLLPPGLNSQLQDSRPGDKIEAYRKTGLRVAGEIDEFGQRWSKRAIKARETHLLDWATREWA